ncbi:hypothetical protein [Nonomuraea recticatena]|uniref:hypothetical protein n=1 Tax=Nonomuraea recticatena TaxID=46178 RepID=UPI0036083E09
MISAIVEEAFGDGCEVVSRTRLSGGASRETWAVDVVDGDERPHRLVVRLAAAHDDQGRRPVWAAGCWRRRGCSGRRPRRGCRFPRWWRRPSRTW